MAAVFQLPIPFCFLFFALLALIIGSINQWCLYARRNTSHLAHLSRQWCNIIHRTTSVSRTNHAMHVVVYGGCYLFFTFFERTFPAALLKIAGAPDGVPILVIVNYFINAFGLVTTAFIGFGLDRHVTPHHQSSLTVLNILSLSLTVLSAMISLVPNFLMQAVVCFFVMVAKNVCFLYLAHFILSSYKQHLPSGAIFLSVISGHSLLVLPLEALIGEDADNIFYIKVAFAILLTLSLCHPILLASDATTEVKRMPPGSGLLRRLSTAPIVPKIVVIDEEGEESCLHKEGPIPVKSASKLRLNAANF